MLWLCFSQADLDIREINKLTAEAIQTPLKSARSECFSESFVVLRELRPRGVAWLLQEASVREPLPSNVWSSGL